MNLTPSPLMFSVACRVCGQATTVKPALIRHVMKHGVTCPDCMPSKQVKVWSKQSYQDYLQSEHWTQFREQALAHYGSKCYICGDDDTAVEVHHNTYERLGGELMSDVIPLCRDCHQGVTDMLKARRL